MKRNYLILSILLLMYGCAKKPELYLNEAPNTLLEEDRFENLYLWNEEDFEAALKLFQQSCKTERTQELYRESCKKAEMQESARLFLEEEFTPYRVRSKEHKRGVLTGYYEPYIHASLLETERYHYPIYAQPNDLINVELSSIYPELKKYRLRGRVENGKLLPYYSRKESKLYELDAEVLCYCDSKIDRFFLEIQGSGRALFDDNSSMFIGYENQNGHRYRAIGEYLVSIGALHLEEVSLQSIREWLRENPSRIDEVLNYNASMVFFGKREQAATGALGVELTPKRSIAVDREYIPLGSMVYIKADTNLTEVNHIAFAQDTGGAIKGALRADIFMGSGESALYVAGHLKAPLDIWILLPKNSTKQIDE